MSEIEFEARAPDELQTIGDWWRFSLSSMVRANASFGQGTATPAEDASFLILGTLNLPLDAFDQLKDYRVTRAEAAHLYSALRQRCLDHIPTAYILGFTELLGYRFRIDGRALIPRSYLAELIVEGLEPWFSDANPPTSILDLCTGSGCLAIIAQSQFPASEVCASDLSPDALALAAENLHDYAMEQSIDLREGDLLTPWSGRKFDIIVCNPPYVTDESMTDLGAEMSHEPPMALAAGSDGCEVLRRLLPQVASYLTLDGMLLVDVGHNRAEVESAFPEMAFTWLSTQGADDGVFMLHRKDLPA